MKPPTTYVVYTNRTRGDLLGGGTAPPPRRGTLAGLTGTLRGLGANLKQRLGEQLVK